MSYRLTTSIMECRTASARVDQGGRVPQSNDRESLAGGFLRRRALRDTLGASGVATDDWEGCLRVHCKYSASVGVKRERSIRLSSL